MILPNFYKKQLLSMNKNRSMFVNMLFAALILLNECVPFTSDLVPGHSDKDCDMKVRI